MVQKIDLYMSCPVSRTGCIKYENPGYWEHADCGGRMYIDTDTDMGCYRCNYWSNWKNWSFACSRHPLRYEHMDDRDFLKNLGLTVNLYPANSNDKAVLKKILEKLVVSLF
ncbi:2129_t:CDS:1 [Cetraspora pellucida]|uniref:2129_t:CDS:1 n=1 Tax=Cetraspora pellucida TaxID=1433469 RepID=A0A9N9JHZ0_9GLOM|nr:2129_t:CDS:1 [Cetraspora pellucida]